ncbi:MAG: DUF2225 domain-containing protein [Lachnospiraceae bacterium]|nr:DUF2225 domain-containing protein [Lachnospiraceae bacterium]
MAGLLSGLESLGLGSLENASIFEKKDSKSGGAGAKAEPPKVEEQDLIYERNFSCPVCSRNFTAKVMKTGKAKLKGMDFDLRPRYEGIAAEKYDVLLCPHCGYAAIARFFPNILSAQAKLIRENISENVVLGKYYDEIYSYEEALERYKLALACSVVKRGKASEKAYVCLKTAWVMRGYAEDLTEKGENDKAAALRRQEEEYLQNAYTGFLEARQSETFPVAGMDEPTVDFLIAELAFHLEDYSVCSRMISGILTSPSAPARLKDRARDLKDLLMEAKK